jgi:hypothetical protein
MEKPTVEIGQRADGKRPFPLERLAAARTLCARGRGRRERREQAEIDIHRLEASGGPPFSNMTVGSAA